MTKLAGAAIGVIVGGLLLHWPGVVAGLVVGLLSASVTELRKRVDSLEDRIVRPVAGKTARPASEIVSSASRKEPEPTPVIATPVTVTARVSIPPASSDIPAAPAAESHKAAPPPEPGSIEQAVDWLRSFFTSGNLVVKVGVIVLFFGVGFC